MVVYRDQKSLPEFLDEYKEYAALAAHWVLMGPSKRKTRPETGGVMRDYNMCRRVPSPIVKSITKTHFLANIAGNPHTFEYRYSSTLIRQTVLAREGVCFVFSQQVLISDWT